MVVQSPNQRDPKGSTARGLLRFTADLIRGQSTALPAETPLEHARRIQAYAKGQEPTDTLPDRMGRSISNFRSLIAGRAQPLPRLAHRDDGDATTGTLPIVSIGSGGIGHPDSKEIHESAEPAKCPCPLCRGEMTWEKASTTDAPHGLGSCQLEPAGWACEDCCHFIAADSSRWSERP